MAANKSNTLVLIDGSSYLYRAFHALPPLNNSRGEPTGAVYGVINMLRKIIAEQQPSHLAVVFDARGKTFRDELFAQYKANRPPMPDELAAQIEPLHALVRAMGLPLLQVPGVEADDVIGTLAAQAAGRKMDVLISTGDKDMAQLVNDHVTLVNTMSDTRMDRQGVIDKFGVPPEAIIDYLALMGDSSDNIPGIPKVGPKTAAKWLQQYQSIDNLVAHADEIKGKVGESLRDNMETLELSRRLATIRRDIELDVDLDSLQPEPADAKELREWVEKLEFNTWLKQLDGASEGNEAAPDTEYETILSSDQLDDWLERLSKAELFAIDTETTSLDYMTARIVGVSFCTEAGRAAYVPLAHDYMDAPEQLERDAVLERLKPLLEDPDTRKVGQNLKYDMNVLANHDITLRGIAFDTMLESYVVDSTATRHDMDSLARKYLGQATIKYEDVAGKGAKQITFNEVRIEQAAPYAAEDAEITLRLHQVLWPRLEQEDRLRKIFTDVEIPLVGVLSRMERRGVSIDSDMLKAQSKALAERIQELEARAHEEAGQEFNLGSPKQIQEILYEKLELPVLAKTPKGQPSTAESVLQELAADYVLPELILAHRSVSKLRSTYTEKLPALVNPDTGRIHTSYHQAVAATGRLSSSDPNLQNIPVRTEEGRRIRQAFIAAPGYCILAADYSQVELRIMAHLSGDQGLLAAFSAGEDIHRATAAEIFGIGTDAVDNEQRRAAKAINFGLIYGMSAFGLARQLKIERGAAQEYVDRYFQRYPGVKEYMETTRARARDLGYVETLFGRRLYVPDIKARQVQRRQAAERTAINAPMQGTAADIIKRAMIAADAWTRESDHGARMIMQVHDELVFEVPENAVRESREAIRACMERAAELAVPLIVDIGSGRNWEKAH